MRTAAARATPGKRDTLIDIERPTTTQDTTYGTPIVTWQVFAGDLWAEFQDELPSRSERVSQGLTVASARARVRFPYVANIDSSMRVVRKGAVSGTYQIVAPPAMIGRLDTTELIVETYSS